MRAKAHPYATSHQRFFYSNIDDLGFRKCLVSHKENAARLVGSEQCRFLLNGTIERT